MTDDLFALAQEAGLYTKTCVIESAIPLDQMLEIFAEKVKAKERERIANQIDRMPFGDTAASFAVWIREGAP